MASHPVRSDDSSDSTLNEPARLAAIDNAKGNSTTDEKKTTGYRGSVEHDEKRSDPEKGGHRRPLKGDETVTDNVNAKLANPLAGMSEEDLMADAERFCAEHDLGDLVEPMRRGAILAGYPFAFDEDNAQERFGADVDTLRREWTNKWTHPKALYLVVIACSMAAIVQGQDQSLINGANIFYPAQFGIGGSDRRSTLILGLVNAAPYFVCATIACWVTDPLNHYFGRKGTILISLVFACFPCIWAAVSPNWQVLFASRCILAFGIGPKSATVPVYAAESAPPAIRGALVMQWQMWTAFGIMLGYVCSLMFFHVSSASIEGLNWRLTLGSGFLPPVIVFVQVLFCPESARWLLEKNRYRDAFKSLRRLRFTDVQACRDLYYIDTLLQIENGIVRERNRYIELFSVPRNRRAALGAFLVMFMQQLWVCSLCDLIMAELRILQAAVSTSLRVCTIQAKPWPRELIQSTDYSSTVLSQSGLGDLNALLGSFGFGMINFLFAIPGIYLIDRWGRRNLLLSTYPLMSLCLLMTGFAFYAESQQVRVALVLLGIYLFGIAYSPGCGPVPFTYSAEAFPLYIRPVGMSFATAVCWLFNGVLAFTFPLLVAALQPQGAFGFYAAMNWFGFFAVLLFLPETKQLSLEELDMVFAVPTRKHAAWGMRQVPRFVKKHILRQSVAPDELYQLDDSFKRTYAPKAGGH